ncbi:hypothetical protein [Streptomyces sp. NBC_01563]|uniref:hypothetical protein n=1 Tax=Streptomyces sp. NBC_01563 TaxID=2975880 RepID=UPI00386B0A0B
MAPAGRVVEHPAAPQALRSVLTAVQRERGPMPKKPAHDPTYGYDPETKDDRPRRVEELPDCPECRREVQLGADRPRGNR